VRERRRRENVDGGRAHFHKVGVSVQEEALLLQRALDANVTIPRLLVEAALAEHGETSTDRRRLQAELFATRRLLASLANNINQIARAANSGEKPGDELTHALRAVKDVSAKIDALLPELVSSR
jgi:hypothetical protein